MSTKKKIINIKAMNYSMFGENFICIAAGAGELQCFEILKFIFLRINIVPILVVLLDLVMIYIEPGKFNLVVNYKN